MTRADGGVLAEEQPRVLDPDITLSVEARQMGLLLHVLSSLMLQVDDEPDAVGCKKLEA